MAAAGHKIGLDIESDFMLIKMHKSKKRDETVKKLENALIKRNVVSISFSKFSTFSELGNVHILRQQPNGGPRGLGINQILRLLTRGREGVEALLTSAKYLKIGVNYAISIIFNLKISVEK